MAFATAGAQESEVGNWFIYFGNQAVAPRWNWHNEVQYRNYNFAGDLQQLLLRTGAGYNLSEKNNNVLLGYAFVRSRNYVGEGDSTTSSDEHRIFQQFITRQNFGRVLIQHRYRFEERSLNDDWRFRIRYLLGLNVPLNKSAMDKGAVYASTYAELFLNTSSPVFDRYRLYGALGYVFSGAIRMELGYMRQGLETEHRDQLQIVIYNNLPLFKE